MMDTDQRKKRIKPIRLTRHESEFEKSPKFLPVMYATEDWIADTEHYDWLYYFLKAIAERITSLAPRSNKNDNRQKQLNMIVWSMIKQLKAEDGDQFLIVS